MTESSLGTDYEKKVAQAAVAAVLDLFPDDPGRSGVIDPQGAADGLAIAIGMIAHNTGAFRAPKARREFAERCRKQVELTIRQLDADAAAGKSNWAVARPITSN